MPKAILNFELKLAQHARSEFETGRSSLRTSLKKAYSVSKSKIFYTFAHRNSFMEERLLQDRKTTLKTTLTERNVRFLTGAGNHNLAAW
ncbi:MAG: hypothetical protein LBF67_01760 [Prevotellaceae bacterium]|jgi:hypothetical protein|nr:hypothetical protein [Prevotellaceae bacterium]